LLRRENTGGPDENNRALRLIVYGGPVTLFLWPTIRSTPAVGISLGIVVAILANFIVWKAEHTTPWQHHDESH
jgi:hypothetical protein